MYIPIIYNSLSVKAISIMPVEEQIKSLRTRLQFAKEIGNDVAAQKIKSEIDKIISDHTLNIPEGVINPFGVYPPGETKIRLDTSIEAQDGATPYIWVDLNEVEGIENVDLRNVDLKLNTYGNQIPSTKIRGGQPMVSTTGLYPLNLHGNKFYLARWTEGDAAAANMKIFHERFERGQEYVNKVKECLDEMTRRREENDRRAGQPMRDEGEEVSGLQVINQCDSCGDDEVSEISTDGGMVYLCQQCSPRISQENLTFDCQGCDRVMITPGSMLVTDTATRVCEDCSENVLGLTNPIRCQRCLTTFENENVAIRGDEQYPVMCPICLDEMGLSNLENCQNCSLSFPPRSLSPINIGAGEMRVCEECANDLGFREDMFECDTCGREFDIDDSIRSGSGATAVLVCEECAAIGPQEGLFRCDSCRELKSADLLAGYSITNGREERNICFDCANRGVEA